MITLAILTIENTINLYVSLLTDLLLQECLVSLVRDTALTLLLPILRVSGIVGSRHSVNTIVTYLKSVWYRWFETQR